ncbi:MAG: hypothetical protein D6688_13250 [Alphaproteobacteria bacterium]|nr:MAG: hypothetical protein D6688_13250 [Alphaproteobacteria bacterium]
MKDGMPKRVGAGPSLPLRRTPEGLGRAEKLGIGFTAAWAILVVAFFLRVPTGSGPEGPLFTLLAVLGVTIPIALIWVAVLAARSARLMQDEAARLRATVEALRQAQESGRKADPAASAAALERKLEELVRAQRAEAAGSVAATGPAPAAHKAKPALKGDPGTRDPVEQPALALGTPAEALAPPLTIEEFIRAMNFPETADDTEGFRALRRALEDHETARLVRAAQDVLTLLSQEGIYMDDLEPVPPSPELWRRFARGERGRAIAALGGIRDRSSLALTSGRMRQDPVFRDAAHHFLRQFDKILTAFERNATDDEIAALANTRTARAFMLLGRVTGTFD